MPSTRYSFSCHTKEDKELIEWLDSFAIPRKRTEAIKERLSNKTQSASPAINDEQIEKLEGMLNKIYRKLMTMKYIEDAPEEQGAGEISEEDEQTALANLLDALD